MAGVIGTVAAVDSINGHSQQVEEEENVGGVVELLKMAGDNEGAFLMLDRELGNRSVDDQ